MTPSKGIDSLRRRIIALSESEFQRWRSFVIRLAISNDNTPTLDLWFGCLDIVLFTLINQVSRAISKGEKGNEKAKGPLLKENGSKEKMEVCREKG